MDAVDGTAAEVRSKLLEWQQALNAVEGHGGGSKQGLGKISGGGSKFGRRSRVLVCGVIKLWRSGKQDLEDAARPQRQAPETAGACGAWVAPESRGPQQSPEVAAKSGGVRRLWTRTLQNPGVCRKLR